MPNELERQAESFEALMPVLMRRLLPVGEEDPLADVPLGQLRVLRALAREDRNVCDLGSELGLSPSSMSQMAQRLSESGFIEKEEDPDSRRHRLLRLTPLARDRMTRREAIRRRRAAQVLAELSESERRDLLRMLEKITGEDPGSEAPLAAARLEKGFML